MYISSEMSVGPASAVGQQGGGLLASKLGSLQQVVVTVVCTLAATGAATLVLDSQLGDNASSQGWVDTVNPPNQDTTWAVGAVALTGFTLPTALNASASVALNGAYRALRLNFGLGAMTAGGYKIQISAEDWKG